MRIDAALQRQLDRVGSHPEGDTPAADEVRLALHAAAAQLTDPEVRRLVLAEHSRLADQAARSDVAAGVPTRSVLTAEQEQAVARVRTMGPEAEQGGESALKRVLLIGGVFAALLVVGFVAVAIAVSAGRGRQAATGGPGGAGGPGVTASAPAPAVTAAAPAGESAGASSRSVPLSEDTSPAPGQQGQGVEETRAPFTDASSIVRAIQQSTETARKDPAAGLAQFRLAIAPLAEWWPKLDPGQRRAADAGVIDFVYVLSPSPDSAVLVIDDLRGMLGLLNDRDRSMRAGDVWPSSWALGMLSRLSVERELPRGVGARIAETLNEALSASRVGAMVTFEDGALSALRRMPVRLVAPSTSPTLEPRSGGEAFKRWIEAVARVGGDENGVERALADALEQVLIEGPEPSEDAAAYEAVEALATRMRWRASGPARARLMEWFSDGRVSVADLNTLTSVIAGKSNAENITPTMILSASATTDDRAQLRAEYALAWGLTQAEARTAAMAMWRANAGAFVANEPPRATSDDTELMLQLVTAVRYNEAARLLWLGDGSGAQRVLDEIPNTSAMIAAAAGAIPGGVISPLPPIGTPSGKLGRSSGGAGATASDGSAASWGESFLRAERNIPVRLERLKAAEQLASPLSRLDASILVQNALFGSPAQVRHAAQQVVIKFADDPAIVLASLDQLPVAPKVRGVSEMIDRMIRPSRLPKLGDPDWEITARRALVDRLLSMLAAQSPQAAVDQGTLLIATSYERMAGPSPTGRAPVAERALAESAGDRAVRAAQDLQRLLRLEADRLPPADRPPMSPEQIERRLASRLAMASGPVQQFNAEQAAVAEMLAYVVCAERPVQSAGAAGVIADLLSARRQAGHILQQMIATEQAMTRLWSLRFGEGSTIKEGGS